MKDKKDKRLSIARLANYSDDVPVIHASGFFGGLNNHEGHISIYQDILHPKTVKEQQGGFKLDTIEHKFVLSLKLSPVLYKRMAYWMLKHIQNYEKKFGKINVPGLQEIKQGQGVDYEFV